MKSSHAIAALLVLLVVTSAEIAPADGVPPLLSVQGRLSDMSDIPVSDGMHSVIFSVYADSLMVGIGFPLWAETLTVQVSGGLFSEVLGRTTTLPTTLFDGGPNRFMGVRVDDDVEMPRVRFNSVGYALKSQNADVGELALDITCMNCVGAGEIAPDAVGPAEIATNAVGSDEIAANAVGGSEISTGAVGADEINTGAVRSDEVQDGTLTAVDLMDEPGLASAEGDAVVVDPSEGRYTLLTHVIDPPGPGYLLSIASGTIGLDHDSGFWGTSAFIALSTDPSPSFLDGTYIGLSGGLPSGGYSSAVTVHEIFATNGGPDTVHLYVESTEGDHSYSDFQLTIVYLPTAYGTVTTTGAAQNEPGLSIDSRVVGDRQSQSPHEPEDTLIKQLEARIKALEEQAAKKSSGEN